MEATRLPRIAPCHPLIAIVGPTGSGKSALALRLAEEFDGEILNCDSLQVYRHFDIGSAKLAPGERRGIRHHLVDVADPGQLFTAGDYARLARPVLDAITSRSRLPLVAGGTGFYLRALLDGLFEGPTRDPATRARLLERENARPGFLHRLLRRADPASAARIHANDINKLIRALEVRLLTGRPISELFRRGRDPLEGFRVLKLGLDPPRAELYRRIDARARRMFDDGLVEETRRILDLGYDPGCKPFQALGYAQALRVLHGEMTLEHAIEETARQTRRYAKRQLTWFRREPGVEWLGGFGDDEIVQQSACQRTRGLLAL